jgi:hypothetical protein
MFQKEISNVIFNRQKTLVILFKAPSALSDGKKAVQKLNVM